MIIFEPRTHTSERGTVELRAGVESRVPPKDGSQELVFEYPLQWSDWIPPRADAFVAALVLRAMNVGEDIEVRAPLSPRLARGLEEYQRVLASWFPHRLTQVEIRAPLEPAPVRPGRAVLTAFSGGVDSFYTLRAHAAEEDPDERARITHALFVHGFDLPLGQAAAAFDVASARYAEMLGRLGIELVPGRTNVQSFVPRRDWGLFHGSALLATALAIGDGVRRFYVPATHTYDHLVPYGSDPRIDPLLRTEAMEVVHDGADVTRVQKTAAIGAWPPTLGLLRVCVSYDPARPNCCRCEKCARTMMTLDLLGLLDRQTSFPRPLLRSSIRACKYRNRSDLPWPRQIFAAAVAHRRWDLVFDLTMALGRSIPAFVRRTLTYRFLRLRALVPGLRPGPASYLP
jgi:hypothetical protein